MPVNVKIPFEVRVDKTQTSVDVPAGTLREVIDRVAAHCPGFAQYALESSNSLRHSITVFLDDREMDARLNASVPDGARLEIIRMIAGG